MSSANTTRTEAIFTFSPFFALEFIQNKPTPPYTYGLGKVGTTSGSEHTTRQNRTEAKPDGARETRWGEGAGVALCGCGSPFLFTVSGESGGVPYS